MIQSTLIVLMIQYWIRLRDARLRKFETSILSMIQSSSFNGPFHFDCF